jgi:hypothetical protein
MRYTTCNETEAKPVLVEHRNSKQRAATCARARALIRRMTPFDVWVREAPRSGSDKAMYWRVLNALQQEAANRTPRVIRLRSARRHVDA